MNLWLFNESEGVAFYLDCYDGLYSILSMNFVVSIDHCVSVYASLDTMIDSYYIDTNNYYK